MSISTRIMAAALMLLAGCSPSGPQGARLTVTVVGDAERPGSLSRRLVAEATQPTLVARDGAGQTVAGLATSWRFVDDGRGLILRLRPEQWSDGKALVSADVVAAFRRAGLRREPMLAKAGLARADDVLARRAPVSALGVMAPISRVVELRLDAASPLLLGWLAEPELGVTALRKGATLAAYVASGPVERRELRRREMAASPEARPATILVQAAAVAGPALKAFGDGKTDIVMGEGLAGLGEARIAARGDVMRIDPLWGVYGYVINTLRGPLANAAVRRALVLAVDRRILAAEFGLEAIAPAEGLLPPSLGGAPQPVARTLGSVRTGDDFNARMEEARALLAAAGWGGDHPLRLVLLLPPGREHRSVAERVAADWAQAGVVLAVSEGDAAMQDRLMARGDFDLAVTEASVPVPDAAALLTRWRCGAGPHCNLAADVLMAEARKAGPAERPRLLAESEAAMMTGPPMVPLFTPVRWAMVSRNVEEWVPNRGASHPVARLGVGGRRR